MKIQFTILFLTVICFPGYSQTAIKTTGLCTDAMAQNAKGRWMKNPIFDRGNVNSAETNRRIDEFHELFFRIYPQPVGVDPSWHRSTGVSYFGAKRKYNKRETGDLTFDYLNKPHFLQYYYSVGFFAYRCDAYEKNVLHPGYPGETGTWLNIIANKSMGSPAADDDWTINDLPVITKKPALKKEDGYEILYSEPGYNVRIVLVYRKGVLPYIPVTRKQYLDYCIIYHTKHWDEAIKGAEQMPVRSAEEQEKEKKAKLDKFQKQFGNEPKKLKANIDYYLAGYKTDQQVRDEKVAETKRIKEMELKKFTDELEKTTREGLLDSPAMIRVKYYSTPVFETDPGYGAMLVTENPDYIRKELPKHVPQIFEVFLCWNDWAPQKKLLEIFEMDFPFDKLQAMIDR